MLDAHLASNKHLVGGKPSVADFAVASLLPWADEAKLPLADFRNVTAWHNRMMELPAWREPFPAPRSAVA